MWGGGIHGSFWKEEKFQQTPEGEEEWVGRRGEGACFRQAISLCKGLQVREV